MKELLKMALVALVVYWVVNHFDPIGNIVNS